MSNWYECQKCFKPCDVKPEAYYVVTTQTFEKRSKCCGASVIVRSA